MKEMLKKLRTVLFGEPIKEYYTVLCQSKYTEPGVPVDSFVSSHIFEKWTDAARFAARLEEKNGKSLNVLGVVEFKTPIPTTVTKIHYDVQDENGTCQVSYYWPKGVDTSAQKEAEEQRAMAIDKLQRQAKK